MSEHSAADTPPLAPATTGPFPMRELLTRQGGSS